MTIDGRTIQPCLWFDDQAEEAAAFYTQIFEDSEIVRATRYGKEGQDIHGRAEGSVMTVDFRIEGQPFTALNGGPVFTFNEAISFQVMCDGQAKVDRLWSRLTEGGDPAAQQCGWLKDRFGVSWQIIPDGLTELVSDPDSEASQRAMKVMLGMKKLDLDVLQRAYDGQEVGAIGGGES